MKAFIENLLERKYNFNDEILAINRLFTMVKYYESIKTHCSKKFLSWKHRNNFISLSDMCDSLGISDIEKKAKNKLQQNTLEDLIVYCEYITNIMNISNDFILNRDNYFAESIKQNIRNILNCINYEIRYFKSEDYFKILEKDWQVTEAAEIVQDDHNLGELIYEYRHHSLKGKLYDKADRLCRLYKYFEGIAGKLKSNQHANLASDIGALCDKLDIRHKPSKSEKIVIDGLTQEELENWYDELFKLFLQAIIISDFIDKRKDINELKVKLTKKD